MPTATTISEYMLGNLGALPTTWTPADECLSPATTSMYLGLESVPDVAVMHEQCEDLSSVNEACFPSASEAEEFLTASPEEGPQHLRILYFSPAPACPSDWVTVGMAAKDDDGDIVTSTGVYSIWSTGTPEPSQLTARLVNPPANAFMHALDAGETMAACCPSGFTALPYGPCHRTLSADAWTATEACSVRGEPINTGADGVVTSATFSLFGVEVSGERVIATAEASQTTETRSYSLGVDDDEYVPVTSVDMITIVYQSSDAAGATGSASSDGDNEDEGAGSDESSDGDDEEENEVESAAGKTAMTGGLAVAACAAAGMLGVAMVLPM